MFSIVAPIHVLDGDHDGHWVLIIAYIQEDDQVTMMFIDSLQGDSDAEIAGQLITGWIRTQLPGHNLRFNTLRVVPVQ